MSCWSTRRQRTYLMRSICPESLTTPGYNGLFNFGKRQFGC